MLSASGRGVSAVISLEVDNVRMVQRIAGRFACAECGEGYHEDFKPTAKPGTCDVCGATRMTRRADDNAKTAMSRLDAYQEQTAPLAEYFDRQGVLRRVDAMGAIDAIAGDISRIVRAI